MITRRHCTVYSSLSHYLRSSLTSIIQHHPSLLLSRTMPLDFIYISVELMLDEPPLPHHVLWSTRQPRLPTTWLLWVYLLILQTGLLCLHWANQTQPPLLRFTSAQLWWRLRPARLTTQISDTIKQLLDFCILLVITTFNSGKLRKQTQGLPRPLVGQLQQCVLTLRTLHLKFLVSSNTTLNIRHLSHVIMKHYIYDMLQVI